MSALLKPGSVDELVEAIRSAPQVLAMGRGTKPRLSESTATKISLTGLRGIIEYEPSEFTFTALAGTPVAELADALAKRGQYLPFDPLLKDAGATLGGTLAAGLSGPGRFRFGGVRDFILGVRFADGMGRLLRMGGKVVKNTAGFDVPKFFVGSLGRFGVLVELTFKVFPQRPATLTCRLASNNVQDSARLMSEIARSRFEPDAIDMPPGNNCLLVRLAGPAAAIQAMARDLLARWPGEILDEKEAERVWTELGEFRWTHAGGLLIKVPLAPDAVPKLRNGLDPFDGHRMHVSSAGNVAFVSLPGKEAAPELVKVLGGLGLTGLTLSGDAPLWLGIRRRGQIALAVKKALDPAGRFPGLEDG